MSENRPKIWRVAIVGGGASGLMAALAAALEWREALADGPEAVDRRGESEPSVIILEKLDRVGRKILATGNGRCNLSNLEAAPGHYHGQDSRFASGALHRLTVDDTLRLFRRLGLLCRTEEGSRIYPYSLQASAVLDLLRLAAAGLKIRIETSFPVQTLQPASGLADNPSRGFLLTAEDGREIRAERVIVATGGLAAPAFGCDGSGYGLFTRLGHRLTDIFPALVQIRTETDLVHGLAGIKFEGKAAVVTCGQQIASSGGEILFTEYGLSGPPLLDLSRTVAESLRRKPDEPVRIILDLLPEMTPAALREWLLYRRAADPQMELADFLTGLVHKKVGQTVLKRCLGQSLGTRASVLSDTELIRLAEWLKALPIRAVGTRDWSQAQVTAGGLDVRDFRPDSLESRLQTGLFACGEILDIDGDCGGFNLQWAWSSGFVSGRQAMRSCLDADGKTGKGQ